MSAQSISAHDWLRQKSQQEEWIVLKTNLQAQAEHEKRLELFDEVRDEMWEQMTNPKSHPDRIFAAAAFFFAEAGHLGLRHEDLNGQGSFRGLCERCGQDYKMLGPAQWGNLNQNERGKIREAVKKQRELKN